MKRLLSIVILLAATLPSHSQSTPSTTLATNVEEVSFDLVARDGKGRIVRDLRPEELQVFDNGAPVKLTSLRINETGPQTPGSTRLVIFLFAALPGDAAKLAADAAAEMVLTSGSKIDFAVLVLTPRLRLVESFTHDQKALLRAIGAATRFTTAKNNLGFDAPENALRTLADKTSQEQTNNSREGVSETTGTT